MNKAEIMNKVNRGINRAGLQIKKHSPEILVGAGIVGFITTAVLAYKASPKVNEVLESAKNTVDDIHRVVENPEQFVTEEHPELYTVEESKKDLAIVYAQTGIELIKACGPAIATGTLSTLAILSGYNILRKRYVATAAAYMVLDQNFKDYRGRVIERFGKELDRELRFNIKAKEIDEIVVNEDGSETVVKTTVQEVDPKTVGDYARFFDEWCTGFEKGNPEFNLMTLKNVEDYLNDKLRSNGHLFLNEAYDALGFPRTPIGAVVGWLYTDHPDFEVGKRDGYVSFGVNFRNASDPTVRDFINGREPAILLEFNVDGPIFELIGHHSK